MMNCPSTKAEDRNMPLLAHACRGSSSRSWVGTLDSSNNNYEVITLSGDNRIDVWAKTPKMTVMVFPGGHEAKLHVRCYVRAASLSKEFHEQFFIPCSSYFPLEMLLDGCISGTGEPLSQFAVIPHSRHSIT